MGETENLSKKLKIQLYFVKVLIFFLGFITGYTFRPALRQSQNVHPSFKARKQWIAYCGSKIRYVDQTF
jgi:hypothetical protein